MRVLVHGAWRGPHPRVAARPHPHPLHLAVAGVIGHALLVHGLHWLVHLVHVVLRVSSGPLGWDGVSCRGRPRAGPHHAVGGARRGPRARAQHGSRGGARARGGAWPRSSTQRWVRRGHLHPSCGQGSPAGTAGAVAFTAPPPPLHAGPGAEWASRLCSRNKEAAAAAAEQGQHVALGQKEN